MLDKFCPYCGAANTGTSFCPSCGGQLVGGPAPNHSLSDGTTPKFDYPKDERHSEIITSDQKNGEPVVEFRHLHPSAVWLFFFQYLGKSSILILLLMFTALVEPLLSVALVGGYFITMFLVAKLNYNHYRFEVSTKAFRKEYGIFHKYSVNIAFEQIQNINMRRTVLDQMLGLAHLELETAGTGGEVKKNVGGLLTASEGYIPGISPEEAKDVKTLILARINRK